MGIDTLVMTQGNLLKVVAELARMIQTEGFQIVHCHGSRANLLGTLLKGKVHVPLVTTVHEYAWWEWEPRFVPKRPLEALKTWGQRRGLWDREDGFLLTGSDALITTNAHFADTITARLPRLSPRLYHAPLVANVDVAPVEREESRDAMRSRYGWPRDAPVIAFFGFLHPVKGLETLLEAFAQVLQSEPRARLLLVGGVESLALCAEEAAWYWEKLRSLVSELGLNGTVALTGYVPEDVASRLLSGADVGVLPFNHGVTLKSGTLLALFAHGLPVAATRADPPEPELIDGLLLRLVERREVSGLADALSDLLADAGERARLREAGHDYIRGLSWSAAAEHHLEVYESVLENASKRPRTKR